MCFESKYNVFILVMVGAKQIFMGKEVQFKEQTMDSQVLLVPYSGVKMHMKAYLYHCVGGGFGLHGWGTFPYGPGGGNRSSSPGCH